jgi:hypothetical protein
MQLGQHRVHLVKKFYNSKAEHWWIVTLYNTSILPSPNWLINVAIPVFAESFLWVNDIVYAVPEGEGNTYLLVLPHLTYEIGPPIWEIGADQPPRRKISCVRYSHNSSIFSYEMDNGLPH